ncbi:MAG: A/G-specific adenine glycosylase [Flavobacteriales bacterium]|jgi:A/G-specific adenine glycosylase
MSASDFDFATLLLNWFDQHGRKNLPWQKPLSAYRVWLSEVMLQQTQVDTVVPYFERFLKRFPKLEDLAKAEQDEVLHLWTGLGYYARARNLHKCAQIVQEQHNGQFPQTQEALEQLPGIGRSTAAAIASIAFGQASAILDGNVKRVLARFHAVEGWPGKAPVLKTLWHAAEEKMPSQRCGDYSQAIMDLGATLCTRSQPACERCPMNTGCSAYAQGRSTDYPNKKPKTHKPTKHCKMLIIYNPDGGIFLEQRPSNGIWGGLWSLPELEIDADESQYLAKRFGVTHKVLRLEQIKHVFSHYTLMIQPIKIQLKKTPAQVSESETSLWYRIDSPQKIGLAAPVKKLLHS